MLFYFINYAKFYFLTKNNWEKTQIIKKCLENLFLTSLQELILYKTRACFLFTTLEIIYTKINNNGIQNSKLDTL